MLQFQYEILKLQAASKLVVAVAAIRCIYLFF